MVQLAHKDSHTRLLVAKVDVELHVVLLRKERSKVVLHLLLRNQEVVQVEFDTHEEHILRVVDMLIEVDDVTLVERDEVGYLRDDARLVGAMKHHCSCVAHKLSGFTNLFTLLTNGCKVKHYYPHLLTFGMIICTFANIFARAIRLDHTFVGRYTRFYLHSFTRVPPIPFLDILSVAKRPILGL